MSNAYLYFEFEEHLYISGLGTNLSAGKACVDIRGAISCTVLRSNGLCSKHEDRVRCKPLDGI